MIIITGSVRIAAGNLEEAITMGCEHSRRSREEPGCISHDCHVKADEPDRMMFFERWADAEAVARHFAVPESRAFVARIGELALSPPELRIYAAQEIDPASL